MARNDTYYNRIPMLVDPAKVKRMDEFAPDNLLHVDEFEDFTPPGVEPSPTDQLTPPEPSVGEGTGSYLEQAVKPATPEQVAEMYATGYPMAKVQAAIDRSGDLSGQIAREGGGELASRTVSTAPDWYQGGKPPPSNSGWATTAQVLGSVGAAPHLQALKDPKRPAGLKQQDARSAAMATGLSTLLSNLFTKGADSKRAELDAAVKEAQMTKTLPGGKSHAQLELDATNNYIEQAQRGRGQDDVAKKRAYDQAQTDAELNPNDPQAIAWRDALIAARVPEAQVRGLGRKALQGIAAANNITLQAGHTASQKEVDANEAERQIILKQKLELDSKLNDELRKEQTRRGESAVPEVDWVNNTPPPGKAVEDVRELYRTKKGFIDRIDRMRAIQPRIEQLAREYARKHGLGDDMGKALAMMGPLMKWTETVGPEAQDLVNEASVLQRSIQNFIRSESYSNLGVMQKWEDLMTKVQIPTAGSVTGFMRGESAWKGLRNDVERMWQDGVTAANGRARAPGQAAPDSGARTPEQQIEARPDVALPPKKTYNPRTGQIETQPESEPVPTATDTLSGTGAAIPKVPGATPPSAEDAAKIAGAKARGAPAPVQGPAGTKHYTITAGNKTKEVDYTPAQYQKFTQDQAERIAKGVITIKEG